MKKLTTKDFIERSEIVHNYKYDYSESIYTFKDAKIIIICPFHGKFEQSANSHMRGFSCSKCAAITSTNARRKNINTFIDEAKVKHDGLYSYDKFNYTNARTPSTIVCSIHGEFYCSPDNHLRGKGCPKCAKYGYQQEQSGVFYILNINDECIKFGITNNIKRRLKELKLNFTKSIKVLYEFRFLDGSIPKQIEDTVIKSEFIIKPYYTKLEMPNGYTETTPLTSLITILSIVEKYMPVI